MAFLKQEVTDNQTTDSAPGKTEAVELDADGSLSKEEMQELQRQANLEAGLDPNDGLLDLESKNSSKVEGSSELLDVIASNNTKVEDLGAA